MVIVVHVGIASSRSFFHRAFSSSVIFDERSPMATFLVLTRQYVTKQVTHFSCSRSLWGSAPEIQAKKWKARRAVTLRQGPRPGSQRHRCEEVCLLC